MKSRFTSKWVILGMAFLACSSILTADEYYAGGVTVDIDREVLGYLWVEDATVNLYENAHIKNDLFLGDVWSTSGSVINIYGGQIDGYLLVTTSGNTFPEAQVTVYGTDFAVDGVPVDYNTTELLLQDQELSGVYASGTPFAFMVDCLVMGDFYMTVKLGWIISEADIDVPQVEYDFGLTDIGTTRSGFVTVYNTGNANLTLQSAAIVQVTQAVATAQNDSAQFQVAPLQQIPVTIEPDTALEIEILYTPQFEGLAESILQLVSDDPDESLMEVALIGQGNQVVLTPAEQIEEILVFYKASLEDGSIIGTGKGRSSQQRVRVFEKTLNIAQGLIESGYEKYALDALKIAEKQCDGSKKGCDFVKGDGVPLLNEMLNALIESINEIE